MSLPLLAIAIGCVFLAALCQSVTGFGFALVLVPLLSLVWGIKQTVVLSVLLGPVAALPAVIQLRRHARPRVVAGLLAGGLAGVPAGTALLVLADAAMLRLLIAAVVLLSTVMLLRGATLREPQRPLALALLVGTVSGILRSATSMGGPPVTLYLLGLRYDARTFVATSATAYVLGSIFAVAALLMAGQVTAPVIAGAGSTVPAMLTGSIIGLQVRRQLSERRFRALALLVMLGTSLVALLPALRGLAPG